MIEGDIGQKIEQLKAVKSAFILEGHSLSTQGLEAFARPFYEKAAQGEIALAELFFSLQRQEDASISLFSAGSCLVKARQFQKAIPILQRVIGVFPEAKEIIERCYGKNNEPLGVDMPELRAIVNLLLKKHLITEDEWARAIETAIAA